MTGEKNDPLPPLSTTRSPNDGYGTSKGEKGMLDDGTNSSSSVFDFKEGDEALQLVGAVRTAEFSDAFNARLRRRLDFVIPPICAAVYFTQYLDKTALNYASVMGLPIVGSDFNLISMAFYLGFLVWEFPTVYIAQKLRLSKYLGCNVILWGIVLMCQAATTNFSAFFALRFILGMLESCVSPILVLIISMFYKKEEQSRRISWFYLTIGLSQVFGGFIAYGVSFSKSSLAPYRIIFLILGALAIIVGLIVLVWLPDSPVHAKMLSKEEKIAALERVRDGQGGTENRQFKPAQIREVLTDARTWLIALTTLMTSIPNGGLSSFSNLIIKGIGYTSKQTLILSTPAGLVLASVTLVCGWYSDRRGERMIPIIFAIVPTIVGTVILIGLNDSGMKGVLLFGVYLIGTFGSSLSTVYAYNATNTSGHTKKLTINALTMISFSIGNIIGTEIFQPKDAPDYIPGKTAIMVLMTVQLGVTLVLRLMNVRLNKKRKVALEAEKARRGWTDEDIETERQRHAFMDLTDKQNIFFVYTP